MSLTYKTPMSITDQLLAEIEAFLIRHDMASSTFGRISSRDPHILPWLRKGNGITTRRYEHLKKFMANYEISQHRARARARARRKKPTSRNSRAAA